MIYLRMEKMRDSLRFKLSEWGLGLVLVLWGLILLVPFATFDGPSYSELTRWASERTWGAGCLALGSARVVVLVINGAWRKSPHMRAAISLLSTFVWVQISLGLWGSGALPTGLAVYPVFVWMELQIAFRAASDARLSDEASKNGCT